jgi:hypothetical protein
MCTIRTSIRPLPTFRLRHSLAFDDLGRRKVVSGSCETIPFAGLVCELVPR